MVVLTAALLILLHSAALQSAPLQSGPQAATPAEPPPIAVSHAEAEQHMTEPGTLDALFIRVKRTPREMRDSPFAGAEIDVVIDTCGAVVSAKAVVDPYNDLPQEILTQAESRVRALHFKPFERSGHAVAATLQLGVSVLPQEVKPARHVPFPKVRDWKTVKITLERASPFATDYTISVLGDGTVVYKGFANMLLNGRHRGTVSQSNVEELVKLFEQVDYFSLRDEYVLPTDTDRQTTSIVIDGHRKQVVNAAGREVGMPLAVERLEDAIDRLTGSERWTKGNAETLAALQAEYWNFKSTEAANTLARAAQSSSARVVQDLVRAGVPLTGYSQIDPEDNILCCSALEAAAGRGDTAMLQLLLDAGAGNNPDHLGRALVDAAGSGNLEAFHLLLDHQADINARDFFGRTLLIAAAASKSPAMVKEILKFRPDVNAVSMPLPRSCAPAVERAGQCEQPQTDGLTALMEAVGRQHSEVPSEGFDPVEVVRLLLAAGADANARDAVGNTTLRLSLHNPEIVRLLLQAGADVNALDRRGLTVLSHTENDEVRRLLIEHGVLDLSAGAQKGRRK